MSEKKKPKEVAPSVAKREEVGVVPVDELKMVVDAEFFKDVFGLASALIDTEVQMEIIEGGVEVKQFDESRVARTDLFLPKEAFKELVKGDAGYFRLDVGDITAILARVKAGDDVSFSRMPESGKLLVEVLGKRQRRFELLFFEKEEMRKTEPKIVFTMKVKTCVEGLVDAMRDAAILLRKESKGKKAGKWSGTVTMIATKSGVMMKSQTENMMRTTQTSLLPGWDIMGVQGTENATVMLGLPFLIPVIEAVNKITNMAQLELASDMPLKLTAELPFKGSLIFWIAPRIEVEEQKE